MVRRFRAEAHAEKIARKIKYPKIALLLAIYAAVCVIFYLIGPAPFGKFLQQLGYAGIFIAGTLYTYGFTSAPATAILLIMAKGQAVLLAALIGGLGALAGDLTIFRIFRYSVADEIKMLAGEPAARRAIKAVRAIIPWHLRRYAAPVLGALIIASPLPDEAGILLLATSGNISQRSFIAISYVLNTAGIFAILAAGAAL